MSCRNLLGLPDRPTFPDMAGLEGLEVMNVDVGRFVFPVGHVAIVPASMTSKFGLRHMAILVMA